MEPLQKTRPKTDAPTVILHWALVLALGASLLTGLRMAADDPDATWAKALSFLTLQGDVVRWHIAAAYALMFVTLAYVVFLRRAKVARRLALNRDRMNAAMAKPGPGRWRIINVAINWIAFALIGIATLTGVLLYALPGLLPYKTLLWVHLGVAWSIILYVGVHIAAQLTQGGIQQVLKILRPRPVHALAGVAAVAVTSVAAATIYMLDDTAVDELRVGHAAEAPKLDGKGNDAAWQMAEAVTVATQRGINSPGGEVDVTVKMVRNGQDLYALFQWPDATRSRKHLPLRKTEKGWTVMQMDYAIQDEDLYYEDKFGVMFAATSALAGAGTSHLGPKPLGDKPAPAGGRGLHYTTDGSIVDVWHWKSVRTGASGQIDDNYFGPPMEVNPKKKRYTGGYTQDPGTGGGYEMNWEGFDTDVITPKRLPKDPSMLARWTGEVDANPRMGDTGNLWMALGDTIPYSPEADTYPVGTIMPSVLIKGARQGDRGDISAGAEWKDGVWTLEAKRRINTGSEYDVSFVPGEPIFMWVATFNHAQTRHSQHLRPVQVVIE